LSEDSEDEVAYLATSCDVVTLETVGALKQSPIFVFSFLKYRDERVFVLDGAVRCSDVERTDIRILFIIFTI
jgi:hypothetical protein